MSDKTYERKWIKTNDIAKEYRVIEKVGKGTYGTVFKVQNLKTNKKYAIKKLQNNDVKLQAEGFPITALRQISLLKQMDHPNIIKLKQIILSKPNMRNRYRGSTFLVFQYMDHDLAGLSKSKVKFTLSEIKCIIKQLLQGVAYLHEKNIMHRDIKSANILVNDHGQVKLADFGLGRHFRADCSYTYKVVTLWYRAPQLLLGSKIYDTKVDVWSIGCVLAQFLIGDVLFKQQSQYAQLQKIYEVCGGIQQNKYPEDIIQKLSYYSNLKPKKSYPQMLAQHLKKIAPNIDNQTIQFLKKLLKLNPRQRYSCEEALKDSYFNVQPLPCKPDQIIKMDYQCHELFRDRAIAIKRSISPSQSKSSYNDSNQKDHKHGYKKRHIQQSRSHTSKQISHQKQDKNHFTKRNGYRNDYLTDYRNDYRKDYKNDRDRNNRDYYDYNSKKQKDYPSNEKSQWKPHRIQDRRSDKKYQQHYQSYDRHSKDEKYSKHDNKRQDRKYDRRQRNSQGYNDHYYDKDDSHRDKQGYHHNNRNEKNNYPQRYENRDSRYDDRKYDVTKKNDQYRPRQQNRNHHRDNSSYNNSNNKYYNQKNRQNQYHTKRRSQSRSSSYEKKYHYKKSYDQHRRNNKHSNNNFYQPSHEQFQRSRNNKDNKEYYHNKHDPKYESRWKK